ncbi:polyprenyl synthetase family protein [Chitinophaga sp. Mgbs1]|uniref:Polyprenyl synthetase family protein n=1 Tax=Chitinophaga solisilvae TaxID=1233460 RepID=A0A3S1DS58_9BACT|nr:polyprenyl synthetase family protein [Chitinophaga solisilvae]
MNSLNDLIARYFSWCNRIEYPEEPRRLYDASRYFLESGGKKIRPILCLLGNDLFGEMSYDSFHAGYAIDLFHNSSLVHDDIIDHAPLRRGRPAIHIKYSLPTAILTGDIFIAYAFAHLNNVREQYRHQIHTQFSRVIIEVCEGQQMDFDLERRELQHVSYQEYLKMITLKTAALMGASIRIGAVIGGADSQEQAYLYEFGKNLGIAFQIYDDYLDAFGEPSETGKQPGGDILENKKTALLIKTWEAGSTSQKKALKNAMSKNGFEKVSAVLELYRNTKVDIWATDKTSEYTQKAFYCLDMITGVTAERKAGLIELTNQLLGRRC